MGAVPSAGFDPIFWSHHCMIDRLWYMWQLEHPNALPPRNIMEESLPPSRLKVKDVLDIDELGYTYASDQIA